jgi:hypothetical protein
VTEIPPALLGQWEAKKTYGVQFKMNGTGSVITVDADRQIHAMTRHREIHKLWQPSEHTRRPFLHLKGGNYVFFAELMHSKVSGGPRDTLYINDIGVANGKVLVGTTFAHRQKLLQTLFNTEHLPVSQSGGYWIIDEHTWLARVHTSGFYRLYQGMAGNPDYPAVTEKGCEGIVLKKLDATLAFPGNEKANVTWMMKCRLPTKGYNW